MDTKKHRNGCIKKFISKSSFDDTNWTIFKEIPNNEPATILPLINFNIEREKKMHLIAKFVYLRDVN